MRWKGYKSIYIVYETPFFLLYITNWLGKMHFKTFNQRFWILRWRKDLINGATKIPSCKRFNLQPKLRHNEDSMSVCSNLTQFCFANCSNLYWCRCRMKKMHLQTNYDHSFHNYLHDCKCVWKNWDGTKCFCSISTSVYYIPFQQTVVETLRTSKQLLRPA